MKTASFVTALAFVLVGCAAEGASGAAGSAATVADPAERSVACMQGGDGVNTFELEVFDTSHARVTTDIFHTPSGGLFTIPAGADAVRYTVTSEVDTGFVLSPTDPYLVSMIATPTKVEFVDYRGVVLGTVDTLPAGSEFRLDSIHGQGASDLGLEGESVLYSLTISTGTGTDFKEIQGEHRLLIGEHGVEICTVKGPGPASAAK
jgi:hypothetical protein